MYKYNLRIESGRRVVRRGYVSIYYQGMYAGLEDRIELQVGTDEHS